MRFDKSQRSILCGAAAFLAIGVAGLQNMIDPLRRQPAIEPPNMKKALNPMGSSNLQMPFEYSLGALTGFRQVIAGLLWVRADAFFHEGNYDAILPLIRLITWMDPNWLDPYSTGAWHLMYNFTDTDQRSDRRYIPAGMALLKEGVDNNPDIFDMYKELGWNNFDKVHDFAAAAKWYEEAEKNDKNYDVTTVGHQLAHCYERMGNIPAAIAEWQKCVDKHKALLDHPETSPDVLPDMTPSARKDKMLEIKSRNKQGYENSLKNLALLKERDEVRKKDIVPPADANMHFKITRVKPMVLEVSGSMDLVGAKNWEVGKGILQQGPVSGARVDVRLQDAGYKPVEEKEFTFEVDKDLTIMQDSLSIRGGRRVKAGELYILQKTETGPDTTAAAQEVGVYGFGPIGAKGLGVPLDKAIASGSPALTPEGQLQAVNLAYTMPPDPTGKREKQYSPAEVATLFAKLKTDTGRLAAMAGQGCYVAQHDLNEQGTFKRSIDMTKDPSMYSFHADKYDLILSVNPQTAPDFVKDRTGWVGEGWTDKRYLDTKTMPGIRLLRNQIELTKEDLTGSGTKVLFAD